MQDQMTSNFSSLTNNVTLEHISGLMSKIQSATNHINENFQQTILRHQQQFIKMYRVKIYELSKLFHQLKKDIQDKFINNAITQQLQSVLKERDYFKYECLKLNTQYKNLFEDYKNLNQQMVNVNQQMGIYKHLLETEKLKSSEIQKNAQKLKNNFTELASKTIYNSTSVYNADKKKKDEFHEKQKEMLSKLKKQVKQKSEMIRALKAKLQQYEETVQNKCFAKEQRREMYEVFRWCVQSWKRFSNSKSATNMMNSSHRGQISLSHCTGEQFSTFEKKQLLKILFTHPQFLMFIEKLLFNPKFQVSFNEVNEQDEVKKQQILVRNRNKLYELMKKKGFISTQLNKPFKFR